MVNLFKRHIIGFLFVFLAVPQGTFAVSRSCSEKLQALTLKDSVLEFEKSNLGKSFTNPGLIESMKLIENLGLRISENDQYWFQLRFKPIDIEGHQIDRDVLLVDFNDLRIEHLEHRKTWIFVPFKRLPAFLQAASKPYFSSSVEYFSAFDIQAKAKATHVDAKASQDMREIEIQNSYIDRFISRSGQAPYLVSSISKTRTDSTTRIYMSLGKKLLLFPKKIGIRHGFGKKYDRFIQLGVANILADVFRLNLGDQYISKLDDRRRINPEFLFHEITSIKVNVVGIKKSSSSDLPYTMEFEIELAGSSSPDSFGHLSKQRFSAEVEFNGARIMNPFGGITKISFEK